jgi:hypothetical protein
MRGLISLTSRKQKWYKELVQRVENQKPAQPEPHGVTLGVQAGTLDFTGGGTFDSSVSEIVNSMGVN